MYVALCAQCTMVITFSTNHGEIYENIEGTEEFSYKWKLIQIRPDLSQLYGISNIFVKINTKQGESVDSPYWLIDDFRLCSSKDIKVGTIDINSNSVSCESLQNPWPFSNIRSSHINTDLLQCSDPQYTGKNCDINCSLLNYGYNNYCNKKKICIPSENSENICICTSGYRGQDCTEECPNGYYGYNCNRKCGICYNGPCSKILGTCRSCTPGLIYPFCNTTNLPRLLEFPEIINISYSSITFQLKNITFDGARKPTHVQLQFKTPMNYQMEWSYSGYREEINLGKEITLANINRDTFYVIRAILFTEDGLSFANNISDANNNFGIPQVELRTKCEDITVGIEANSTYAVITVIESNFTCYTLNYNITLNINNVYVRTYEFLRNQYNFSSLQPYTSYEVIFTYKFEPFNKIVKAFITLEDAPSPVPSIRVKQILDTEVSLTWNQPVTPNGIIREYIIEYKHLRYMNCTMRSDVIEVITIKVYNTQNTEPKITLNHLKPYSEYNVRIAAKTLKRGPFSYYFPFNTDSSSFISNEVLPLSSSIKIINYSTSARVDYDLPNCENIRGNLTYKVSIYCVNKDWCNEFKSQQNDFPATGVFQISKLIPFTEYNMEIRAQYIGLKNTTTTNKFIKKKFSTPAAEAPTVRNLTIYSFNSSSISIRWLPPYPPNGELEFYVSSMCYYYYTTWYCTLPEPQRIKPFPCDLWKEEYTCYTFNNLKANYNYKISIASKNHNAPHKYSFSEVTGITQFSTEISSEPLNLRSKWEDNYLVLYWDHPYLPNGPIKSFKISLLQIKTDIQETNKENITVTLEVKELMKNYTIKIPKSFQYSSSYKVEVYAVTNSNGKPAILIIDTPPETPQFTREVNIKENAITNTSVIIQIPPINKTTISKDSIIYVHVSELASKTKTKREAVPYSSDLEQMIFNDCSVSEAKNSWIAYELNFQEMEEDIAIVIGNGSVKNSTRLKKSLINIQLLPETDYTICVLLINVYNTKRSSNPYKLENIRTAATYIPSSWGNGGIIVLYILLLLLIPFLIFYVYRRYKNKNQTASPGLRMPMLNVSVSRQVTENHHDPDVIPLTEETSDSNLNRNYIAEIPATSRESTPADVSTSATTNFHSRLVPLNKYEEYLKEAIESKELAKQHALFPRGQTKPWDYGMLKENKFKNRYNNLIAYDNNRVKLEKISKDYYSDYINASYIHGYRQENAYIATQGPKLTTVNDFWRMIWQEKVQYIVMLANVVEGGKKKCEKYWPEIDSSREYGLIDVFFKKFDIYADFEYRTFILTKNEEKRTVTQMHFTSWPDHGVPLYPQSLVPFLKKILTIPQSTAPIVVHCSAGVGRTGTIILIDICLRMAAREGQVDVLRYLHEIREQRANMVDNIDQYKLVHMVLLECLLAPDTNIPCNANFSATVQSLIEDGSLQVQLNNLQNTSWQDKALNFSSTIEHNPLNCKKNRFPNIVPVTNQIYLPRYPLTDETSDYINAIPVDGFLFKEQFIVTQTPMPNTIVDFWRMVAEKSIKIIVSLNNIPTNDSTCCVFWPSEKEETQLTPRFNLKYNKLLTNYNYDIHNIFFNDNESKEQSTRVVQIVQFKDWNYPAVCPNNIENLLTLLEESENLSRGNYPMVVSCYDGATASGLFVAMSFVIEKIKLEQQCDPCLAVRVIRRNRKQFIKNKTQFECLYKSAVAYLNMFETYSNFDLLTDQAPKN